MARKARPMTPADFTAIRLALGLSKTALAKHIGLDRRRVIEIENGNTVKGVPGPVERLMKFYRDGTRPKGVTFPCDAKRAGSQPAPTKE